MITFQLANEYFVHIYRTRLPGNLLYCHISHYEKWSLLVKRALSSLEEGNKRKKYMYN